MEAESGIIPQNFFYGMLLSTKAPRELQLRTIQEHNGQWDSPRKNANLRDIARLTQQGHEVVQKELESLAHCGMICLIPDDGHNPHTGVFYAIDLRSLPIFKEKVAAQGELTDDEALDLVSLFFSSKTVGSRFADITQAVNFGATSVAALTELFVNAGTTVGYTRGKTDWPITIKAKRLETMLAQLVTLGMVTVQDTEIVLTQDARLLMRWLTNRMVSFTQDPHSIN